MRTILRYGPKMETIKGISEYMLGKGWHKRPEIQSWPPYVFAVIAIVLKKSGCYIRVLRDWPPNKACFGAWHDEIKCLATAWRSAAEMWLMAGGKGGVSLPREIHDGINKIGGSTVEISHISQDDALCVVLIKMLSIADEASTGLGIPQDWKSVSRFNSFAAEALFQRTLTPKIPTTIASVLPKQHTPTGGLSIRSMSHHLALHVGRDAYAKWYQVPNRSGSQLNIVIAPWPLRVKPSQFKPSLPSNYMFAPGFSCFDFEIERSQALSAWVAALISEAADICGRIDGIVFPEASLTPDQFETVCRIVRGHEGHTSVEGDLQHSFVMAGVLTPATVGSPQKNQAWIQTGIFGATYVQDKHHKWRLDRRQVEMYGLGGVLDPDLEWWEHIGVQSRGVAFMALDADLTMCCLICEDLARQEPVGELVRAVGPNLVIALLADGPQLAQRWPARYATVLADDPGSSVLTVTSLGMAQLAKPPSGKSRSRSVALWKDALGDVEEITLPQDASGAVICLRSRSRPEWAADGREDTGVASCPQLVGVHYIKGMS